MSKYNVERPIKDEKEPNCIRYQPLRKTQNLIALFAMAGCLTLTVLLSTPDQDPVERARMYQTSMVQQPAYQDSLPDSLNIRYEGK